MPHGYVISKPEKQQQVSLNKSEWSRLSALDEEIGDFFESRGMEGAQKWWSLSGPGRIETRVVLTVFNAEPFLNIRVYMDGGPTKQGVTLAASQWSLLRASLGFNTEAKAGMEVYKDMMAEMVSEMITAKCQGCELSWSSQRDHECLMDRPAKVDAILAGETRPTIDPHQFTARLAEKARVGKWLLEQPFEVYQSCTFFMRSKIDEEIKRDLGAIDSPV